MAPHLGRTRTHAKPNTKQRLVLVALAAALAAITPPAHASERIELDIEGTLRTAWIHVPESVEEGGRVPLLLAFHGSTWNGRVMEDVTGFSAIADREGFIAVYPNGTGPADVRSWNTGYCCSTALEQQVDDFGFVDALLDHLLSNYPIDPARIYATGFSNGAMLTHALGITFPNRLAAIAPVAGALYPDQKLPGVPLPVLIIHGTSDAIVPYNGGWGALGSISGRTDPMLSVRETLSLWLESNGCSAEASAIQTKRNARIEMYACSNDVEIQLVTLVDGAHVWPVVTADNSDFLFTADAADLINSLTDDPTSGDVAWDLFESGIEGSETIWSFFSRHTRIED